MKNFSRSDISVENAFATAAKGLHTPKSTFLKDNRNKLLALYHDYDRKAENGTLESLASLWKDTDKTSYTVNGKVIECGHNDLANDIYDSHRPLISEHWNVMKRKNGGSELMCPICEIEPCKEMDHYVPREKMPEYSVHLSNLIPLCHNCNHKKNAIWLEHGERQFFNAFFDRLSKDVYTASIKINTKTNIPFVEVSLNLELNKDVKLDSVIINMEKHLDLSSVYTSKTNQRLTSLIEEWKTDYILNARGELPTDYVKKKIRLIRSIVIHNKNKDLVENLLYSAILNSTDFKTWIETSLNK